MVAAATIVTLIAAGGASLFMAWAIGAGSSGSTPFAPAVGANAVSVMRAGFFVGILGLAGAVLQGANVSEAVGRELVVGATLSAETAILALVTAAAIVAIGIFTGYPIATAFTVTGAVVGAGLAAGGAPAWAKYQQIAALWILVPFVGSAASYGTAKILRSERIAERISVAIMAGIVGVIIALMDFALLGSDGQSGNIAKTLARALPPVGTPLLREASMVAIVGLVATILLHRLMIRDQERAKQLFLLALGGLVAFSAGGTQVGLAVGPLLPLLDSFTVPTWTILLGGGIGLLLGSWTGAPRMIKALAQDYSSLGPLRSTAALIPSFAIAQSAVFFGIPVSFNEIIVSAIMGAGFAAGSGGVSRQKMVYTVLAWIGSLVMSFAIAYGVVRLLAIV